MFKISLFYFTFGFRNLIYSVRLVSKKKKKCFYLMYILFKFFSITENNFNSCLLLLLLVNFVIDS